MNSIPKLIFLPLVILAVIAQTVLAEIKSPPYFIEQPSGKEILFYVETEEASRSFTIPCDAEGSPAPDYFWTKNDEIFDWTSEGDRITKQAGKGTLIINVPKPSDAGQYQCYAKNIWGIATSNSIFARKIELGSFRNEPIFTKQALKGQPFNLSCKPPTGYPTPTINWITQDSLGKPTSISSPRITVDATGTLWFSNITDKDASDDSLYACVAVSSHISDLKVGPKISLEVKEPESSSDDNEGKNDQKIITHGVPPVRQYTSRSEEIAVSNTRVRLFCIYGGTPLPTITWYKNGKLMTFNSSILSKEYNKILEIKKATPSDEANYTCEASNGVGDPLSHTISLKLLAEPKFVKKPESVTLDEEETVEFHCQAIGTPEPVIVWTHNGKPLSTAPINPRRVVSANSIIIRNLWKNDTGNYGCNATNSVGYIYKDAYVNVLAEPPTIKEVSPDEEILENDTVTLICSANGSPKPQIKWLKNNVELTEDRFIKTKDGNLTINNVTLADNGNYTCFAKNKISSINSTVILEVRQRTRIPPESGPSDTAVLTGNSATFKCSVETDPSLDRNITWLHNGQYIDFSSEDFTLSNDDSLIIKNAKESHSGNYSCVANTRLDKATAEASLSIQRIPYPPELLPPSCDGTRTAEIIWIDFGNNSEPINRYIIAPVDRHVIQYTTEFFPDMWEMIDIFNVSEYNFQFHAQVQMKPWSNYTFRVLSVNKFGTSLPSQSSQICSSPPDMPYKNPENVTVRVINATTSLISWEPMSNKEHNGPGFYYNVSWKLDTPEVEWRSQIIPEWTTTEYQLGNLLPHHKYSIKVVAGNDQGQANSDAELVECITPPDIPYKNPKNLTVEAINSTTLSISWEPMQNIEHNGPGFYYNLSWKLNAPETDWHSQIIPEWEKREYQLQHLLPHQKYFVTLGAGNDQGQARVATEPVEYTTPSDIPYKTPENVTVQAINSTALSISWMPMPKTDHNGPGFYYNVSWKLDELETDLHNQTIQEWEKGEYQLHNLLPHHKYYVTVSAGNDLGQAQSVTKLVEWDTPPDIPFKNPDNVTVEATSPTVLTVSWKPMPENEHNGPGFHYNISWKRDSPEVEWQSHTISDWQTPEYKILDVVPYENYLVTVLAGNNLGNSELTSEAPIECNTPPDIPYTNPNNVIIHASEPTTLQISWEPMPKINHNGPNFYYNVLWKKDEPNAEWQSHIISEWEKGQFTIHDVLPFEKYWVKVTAGNQQGSEMNQTNNSTASESSALYMTPPHIPFKNPDNVAVQATDPTTLTITWKPMPKTEHNGPGFYYKVAWRMNSSEADWENQTILEWEKGEYIVSNQLPYEEHLVKVIAGNSQGESIQPPIIVKGYYEEEVPLEAPKNLQLIKIISPTSAEISWNRVPMTLLKGKFQKYEIETWPEHSQQKSKVLKKTIEYNLDRTSIDQLTPNTKNKIRISVFNGKHQSQFSEELEIDMPEGVPDPVQSLEAKPFGSSALSLAWKPPLSTNGNLTGYKIHYQKVLGTESGDFPENTRQITDPNQTQVKLLGLEPDTNYRINIIATTNAGDGEKFSFEQKTPSQSSALITPDFQIESVDLGNSSSAVKIIWLPCVANENDENSCSDQSIGSEFRVHYKLKGDNDFEETPKSDGDTIIINNLLPSKEYEFVVSSIDGNLTAKSVMKPFKIHTSESTTELVTNTVTDLKTLASELISQTSTESLSTKRLHTQSFTTEKNTLDLEEPTNEAWIGWVIILLAIIFLIILLILIANYLKTLTQSGKYVIEKKESQCRRPDCPEETDTSEV